MIKSRILRLALVGVAMTAMAACARQAETPGPIADNGGTQQPGNKETELKDQSVLNLGKTRLVVHAQKEE